MTTSSICELFRFALRRRKNGSARTTSAWRIACVLSLLFAVTTIASPAQTFRTLVSFNGTNGAPTGYEVGLLVQGLDGNFYGTTARGGAYDRGTLFKITRAGALTTLYDFCSQKDAQGNCSDGAFPEGRLVQSVDGNLYGTTTQGGTGQNLPAAISCTLDPDCGGTIFKITPTGILTTLYSFCAQTNCSDGLRPNGLVQGIDGNFYGTTFFGGIGLEGTGGTAFKISPGGVLTTLHSFCTQTACPDGSHSYAALVQGTDGNFYGTTNDGGTFGVGTMFKITPGGTLTTLHSFGAAGPTGQLVQGRDGNFYGTTERGGNAGAGTVFKITPSGKLTTLHTFDMTDGAFPGAGIIQATDGSFYGTTWQGGGGANCSDISDHGCGTIFKITSTGTLTTLHTFNGTDGGIPGGLLQATSGTFYGVTSWGGSGVGGTIFSLCVGLGWFNEELPNSGKVGDTIDILGTNLTGASSVTFGGFYRIEAPFTIVSPTLIQATVPPGAKTGRISVVLPSGKIPSNVKFRVTPQIASFTPTGGPPGTLVTISGVSLSQIWEVTFRRPTAGGVRATFTVVDDDTVTIAVPTGAQTGPIWMGGPGGHATTTANFNVE